MNRDYKDFVELIKYHINNKPFLEDCNWNSIYKLASIHNLFGIIYVTIKDNKYVPTDILSDLKRKFLSVSYLGFFQGEVLNNVTKKLEEYSYDHILVKGGIVRNYYPYPELRTMGDIDILVRENNKTDSLMSEIGYERFGGTDGEAIYKKGKSIVELHSGLRGMNFKDGVDFDKYFEDIFNHTVLSFGNHTFELEPNSNIIFMIVHMAKHFHNEGCGIRMFLDLALTIRKYGDIIDWSYISVELKKLYLYTFGLNILKICNCFFDINIELVKDYKIDNNVKDMIIDYVLKGGTFGFQNNVHSDVVIRNMQNQKSILKKLPIFFDWVFPPVSSMRSKVSWFKNAPIIFLPIAWIYRDVMLIFNSEKIKDAVSGKDRINSANKTIDAIGLYEK